MKQISYLCKNEHDFIRNISDFVDSMGSIGAYSCILVTMYIDTSLKDQAPQMVQKVKEYIPKAKIIGGTVSANITAGVINTFGISMTFSVFESSQVEVIPVYWDDIKSRDIGKNILHELRNVDQLVAVQILTSGYNLDILPFFSELSNSPSDTVFFGGIVDDGTINGQGFVFTEKDFIYRGHVLAVFKGRSLQIHIGIANGWSPLGKTMTITKLKDPYTICEVDNKSVSEIYKKYLGIEWNESVLDESVVFPFMVYRNNSPLARLPRYLSQDGSANYGADFLLGETVRLCYGDPAAIIQEARNIQLDLVRFQPEGIYAVSCWARKVLLHKDVNQELEACRRTAPSTGIYALGEYVRHDCGQINVNNMCLTILGMREGGRSTSFYESRSLKPIKLQRHNSVLSHMMHFVQAVSNELEEKNRQLSKMAHIDYLTNLLNRGELESELDKSLHEFQISGRRLSLLMLDIDNFKSVNDSLGHDSGDNVLKRVSDVIRESIRSVDVAGRWGGDEFIVILNNTNIDNAKKIAERIRIKVQKNQEQFGSLNITTSIGLTQAEKDDTLFTLFQRVDKALYKAKNQPGKNCFVAL